jgi:hypothetical protein
MGVAQPFKVAGVCSKKVPRPSLTVQREGTSEACSDGLMLPDPETRGAGILVPALAKSARTGHPQSFNGKEKTVGLPSTLI